MKYLAFQNIAGTLPIDWLSEMKNCFNSFLYYFMDRFVITIDGPTGAGKSTIASLLASKLDFLYIDGGIFFRALTLKGIRDNIDLNNEEELVGLSQRISITLFNNKEGILKKTGVLINDEDVSNELWSPSVSNNVPFVSIHNQLREERKTWVRNLAGNYLITEGRTLGREVFPDAILKFYVDASIEKRAERRHLQLKEKGINRGNDDIMKDIFERDEKDRHGKIDRLEMPRDAIYLDTTDLTIDEVVKILINMILPVLKIWKIQKYE